MSDNSQPRKTDVAPMRGNDMHDDNFVLEKSIFSNVFEKDIRRVFIYKKAERLAKAIHLIAPAFVHSPSLRNRADSIAMSLVDAAILPPSLARDPLSRELLALSSLLSIARIGGHLSNMNANLISKEAHTLLQEVAAYEEPHLFLDESPTLSDIARKAVQGNGANRSHAQPLNAQKKSVQKVFKGQSSIKDNTQKSGRKDNILNVLRSKGQSSIKDISTVIRGVSEKTIQRELQSMVDTGLIKRSGERRWSMYALAS
jgi:DNA-binding transcriptional ArsR family regulator